MYVHSCNVFQFLAQVSVNLTPPTSSSVESATNHKDHTPTKSSETRNILKELLQKESLKPEKREKENEGAASIQQKSFNPPSPSNEALVAPALATKKQLSSEEGMSPRVQGNGELSSLTSGTAESSILAQLQHEKKVERDQEEGRKEERERKGAEGETSSTSRSKRSKTVEKPVKSLGIASDPGPPPQPMVYTANQK